MQDKQLKSFERKYEIKYIKELNNMHLNCEASMDSNIGRSYIFDLPNEKAWGRKKKKYYSTDYVDLDYIFVNKKEIVSAEIEEGEATTLHIGLAKELDRFDFGHDLLVAIEDNNPLRKISEYIQSDCSKLCKKQQQQFLEKESPEFILLTMDLHVQLYKIKTELGQLVNLLNKYNPYDCFAIYTIKAKYDMLLHYCINISFYLILKAKKVCSIFHPVIKKLALYRKFLCQFENCQEYLLQGIKKMCLRSITKNPVNNSRDCCKTILAKHTATHMNMLMELNKYRIEEKVRNEDIFQENLNIQNKSEQDLKNFCYYNQIIKSKIGKRAITYQISKNKGLTPYRKKEQRNPRVKHRNKYNKAKICRKGAIREIIREVNRYGGEISGIKTTLKKSIKLK